MQSLQNTIFQTLSIFESYVLFSLRRKEFPSSLLERQLDCLTWDRFFRVAVTRQTLWTEELVIPAPRSRVSPGTQLRHPAPSTGSTSGCGSEEAVENTVSSLVLLIFIPPNWCHSLLFLYLCWVMAYRTLLPFTFLHNLMISLPFWAHLI